jgi:hypothetical protein
VAHPATLLGQFGPSHISIMMMFGLPCRTGLMKILRIKTGADLVGHVVEFHMDSVSFAVGVRSDLLLRQHRHIGPAMTLTHLGYLPWLVL